MPPKKTVPKLEDICYSNVANGLVSLINVWFKTRCCWPWYRAHNVDGFKHAIGDNAKPKEVQEYLAKTLPSSLREKILEKTLIRISESISVPRRDEGLNFVFQLNFFLKFALKFLIFKGITYLDLSPIAHCITKQENVYYYENMFAPRSEIFTDSLDDSDLSLNTLKYLKLPHFVYDEFITLVGNRCTELEYLILNCSSDCNTPKGSWDNLPVGGSLYHLYGHEDQYDSDEDRQEPEKIYDSDGDIVDIVERDRDRSYGGCKKLKQLILPENVEVNIREEINYHGKHFLTCMKDLEYLVGVPMLNLAYIYESILNSGQGEYDMCDKIERIKLKNFYHGAFNNFSWPMYQYEEHCTTQLLSVLTEVNEVSVYAPADVTDIVLKAFQYTQNVTLFTDEYKIHGPYLNNLVKLDINIGHQDEWAILHNISTSSPKLEYFTLRSFSLHVKGNDIILTSFKLPELKTLKLLGQSFIHSNSLYKCLSGCPSITSLYIAMLTNNDEELENVIHDSVILSVIPLLPNLQKFYFKLQCTYPREKILPWLTIATLDAMLEHCPQLNRIERFDTWNISKTNFDNFYMKCKINNWDLEIN